MVGKPQPPSHAKTLDRVRADGKLEGRSEVRNEVFGYLQKMYTGKDAPERGTPEAEAILKVTRDLSIHFKQQWNM